MNAEHDTDETSIIQARIPAVTESVLNAMHGILIAIGRDYERCGKASCARSRRCRGLACEPQAAGRNAREPALRGLDERSDIRVEPDAPRRTRALNFP